MSTTGRFGFGTSDPNPACRSSVLANAKSLIFTRRLRLFFCGELCDWESCVDLRIDGFRDIAWEVGLEERDRFEVVEGAAEARREIAGEGGAGRVEVSDVESE